MIDRFTRIARIVGFTPCALLSAALLLAGCTSSKTAPKFPAEDEIAAMLEGTLARSAPVSGARP